MPKSSFRRFCLRRRIIRAPPLPQGELAWYQHDIEKAGKLALAAKAAAPKDARVIQIAERILSLKRVRDGITVPFFQKSAEAEMRIIGESLK